MTEKLVIEVFRNKTVEDFTKSVAMTDSKLETGSVSANAAALSGALFCRAADITKEKNGSNDAAEYVSRNAGIIRNYMVNLIDEDIKSRNPLKKALKEGDPQIIEAAYQPASCISAEVISLMLKELEMIDQLLDTCPAEAVHYAAESAELAMSAIRSARYYIISMSNKCSDETYKFVTHRENDISLEQAEKLIESIRDKAAKYL